MRGFRIGVPDRSVRSPTSASPRTRSTSRSSDRPLMMYRADRDPFADENWTVPPSFHARLIALNTLFAEPSSASDDPVPAILPGGGTIADAAGFELKPVPGTLSKRAESASLLTYGEGGDLNEIGGPSAAILARASPAIGRDAVITRTPICSGSVHPAAS